MHFESLQILLNCLPKWLYQFTLSKTDEAYFPKFSYQTFKLSSSRLCTIEYLMMALVCIFLLMSASQRTVPSWHLLSTFAILPSKGKASKRASSYESLKKSFQFKAHWNESLSLPYYKSWGLNWPQACCYFAYYSFTSSQCPILIIYVCISAKLWQVLFSSATLDTRKSYTLARKKRN